MIPMKQTPLSQLAIVSAGQAAPKDDEFSDHGIPFVRAGSLDSLLSGKSESDLELVSDETAKLRKLKTYPKGTILFAKSGMSATKDRIYVLDNPAYVVSHLATLIPNGSAHADYLRLALKRFPPSVLIKDPAYPAISLGDIQSYEIPVPEQRDDQIRIAHLLGKVEGLIAQRKQHLQQLDNLLKSVFLEMFGFRDGTYIQWTIERLALHTEVVSGVTKGKKYTGAELIEVPYMRVANVQDGHFFLGEVKTIAVTQKEIDQYRLVRGDLLLTEGGDPDKLGRGSVWEEQIPNCIHQNHIFRVRINEQAEINPYYLSALVSSRYGKAYFLKSAKQTTGIASINSTQLKNFPTVNPPIDLQNHFAAIVEKVESIKSRYQQSLNDLEALYGALSQQAFKGELDLSRVPMPAIQAEEEKTVAAESLHTRAEESLAIHLPDTDNLLAALENAEARAALIAQWLDAYRGQLGGMPFSVPLFMAAAQTRLAELYPDNDFALGANDYEHIKAWVFEALAAGTLSQVFDDTDNRIQLKAVQA
jgi:type I restriction enzyme S subunit